MGQYTILCVDDEENILTALERTFLEEDNYEILTAKSGEDGLKILEGTQVDLIISDQRMPGMSGVEFLKKARELYPDTIRIALSGYADFDTITRAINEGEIYRLLQKPWEEIELLSTVKDTLEKHELKRENKNLQDEIRKQNGELRELTVRLEEKVEERTLELMLRNQTLLLSQEIVDDISIPVLGVGSDGTIALVNKSAQVIYGKNGIPLIGTDIQESLPDTIVAVIKEVFQSKTAQTVTNISYNHCRFSVKCLPLTGQFADKGVVLETMVIE